MLLDMTPPRGCGGQGGDLGARQVMPGSVGGDQGRCVVGVMGRRWQKMTGQIADQGQRRNVHAVLAGGAIQIQCPGRARRQQAGQDQQQPQIPRQPGRRRGSVQSILYNRLRSGGHGRVPVRDIEVMSSYASVTGAAISSSACLSSACYDGAVNPVETHMKTERGALVLSAVMALLLGVVGLTAAMGSGSRAILLDGLFNLTYFMVALITVRVGALAAGPDDERFPYGYAYFESLVNAGKGLLILGISGVALVDAVMTLLTGGREIAAGMAIVYAAFATTACSLTAWMMHRTRRHVRSPLVRADFENWLVNSLISAAVLGAFCLVPLFRWLAWYPLVPYVDAVLVLLVVLLCLSVPIRMASRAIMELLNRAPPASVAVPVRAAIEDAVSGLPVQALYVRMVRPGRMLYVTVHVVLPEDYALHTLGELDAAYHRVYEAVRRVHRITVADVVFTADEALAAPIALQ